MSSATVDDSSLTRKTMSSDVGASQIPRHGALKLEPVALVGPEEEVGPTAGVRRHDKPVLALPEVTF